MKKNMDNYSINYSCNSRGASDSGNGISQFHRDTYNF